MAESRLDELRMVDPVLTTIVQGYSNSAMIADKLFPHVSVKKLKGRIPVFGKEAFISRDSERAIRAQSNRIAPSGFDMVEFETLERDLEIALDYLEEEESPDFFRLEQRVARELSDILALGKEADAAQLAQDASAYPAGLKEALTADTAFDNYQSTSDPITVIKDAMASLRGVIARYPNTLVLGESSYRALIGHPKLTDRVKYSGLANVNLRTLAEILEIPNIYVGKAVTTTDGINFSDLWLDNAILAYVDRSEKSSEYNPSFGYIFRRESHPQIDSYYENGGKIKVIRNTDNYCVKVTGRDAAYIITNTNQAGE